MTSRKFWRGYAFALTVLLLAVSAQAEPLQPVPYLYRDAQGRITGTAESNGRVITFRDSQGRITGTAERMPDGRTEFRDAAGRLTGSSQ